MTVEERREESDDEFPVGMRVLAVDDDPICLRLLEHLLRKCKYHVTTTSQAIRALEMLRENKNKFDLVISDVHMPDMDGFKLLELVGLEMDLPVIMLSANGDTKLVMKGITHGACDYLVKPVRMEELKNIWQHVIRRKRFDSGDHSSINGHGRNSGGDRNGTGTGNPNSDAKLCKKRKDQNSDDDDDSENENENDDPSTQKRPRVVWSVDLHRKFVAAVNQLGLDKAVPKKILELMNVEKLTRENVASHLQKYRLYLKRISSVANQQANMVAALGGPDSPYLRMASVNFHGLNGPSQFQTNPLRTLPATGALTRLNTPTNMGLHGLAGPLGQAHIPRQPNGPVLQGRPTSLEFTQHKRGIIGIDDGNPRVFPVGSGTAFHGVPNNLGIPNSLGMPNSDIPLDHSRSSSSWSNAVETGSHDVAVNSRVDGPGQSGFGFMGENMVQNMGYGSRPVWDDNRVDLLGQAEFLDGSGSGSMGVTQSGFGCEPVLNRDDGFGSVAQPRVGPVGSVGLECDNMFEKPKQGLFAEPGRSVSGYGGTGAGSLEDVVSAMFKQEQDHVEEWRFPM